MLTENIDIYLFYITYSYILVAIYLLRKIFDSYSIELKFRIFNCASHPKKYSLLYYTIYSF